MEATSACSFTSNQAASTNIVFGFYILATQVMSAPMYLASFNRDLREYMSCWCSSVGWKFLKNSTYGGNITTGILAGDINSTTLDNASAKSVVLLWLVTPWSKKLLPKLTHSCSGISKKSSLSNSLIAYRHSLVHCNVSLICSTVVALEVDDGIVFLVICNFYGFAIGSNCGPISVLRKEPQRPMNSLAVGYFRNPKSFSCSVWNSFILSSVCSPFADWSADIPKLEPVLEQAVDFFCCDCLTLCSCVHFFLDDSKIVPWQLHICSACVGRPTDYIPRT